MARLTWCRMGTNGRELLKTVTKLLSATMRNFLNIRNNTSFLRRHFRKNKKSSLIFNISHSFQDRFTNWMRPKDIKNKTEMLLRTRTNSDSSSNRSSWIAWDQMSCRAASVVIDVIWQAFMNDALRYWDTATSDHLPLLQSKDHTSFLVVLMSTGMQHGHAWRTDWKTSMI